MYNNIIDNLNRQKDKIDEMIRSYQAPSPVNNYINTTQTPNKTLIECRILNENEEVDNLYVNNKTLFIGENTMVIKDIDGKLEKWKVKKVYPIDKKDEKINELEEEIRKLKEVINNEYGKSNSTNEKCIQSDGNDNKYFEPKSKSTSKTISK